jgi:hypothetical protein
MRAKHEVPPSTACLVRSDQLGKLQHSCHELCCIKQRHGMHLQFVLFSAQQLFAASDAF